MIEGGTLVGIKLVTSQLMMSHPTDGMNEISTIEILEPALVRVMGVGPMVEVSRGRVFNPVLVTSILGHS